MDKCQADVAATVKLNPAAWVMPQDTPIDPALVGTLVSVEFEPLPFAAGTLVYFETATDHGVAWLRVVAIKGNDVLPRLTLP